MKVLKALGLWLFSQIGMIIIAVLIALITIFPYLFIQFLLFATGDYLLFATSEVNMLPMGMIMILMVYGMLVLKEKLFPQKDLELELHDNNEEGEQAEDIGKLGKFLIKSLDMFLVFDEFTMKIFRVVKITYIPALLIAIYVGMTSYAILYTDSVKISTPVNPAGKTYSYNDITEIEVGVAKSYMRYYTPYYKLIFKDEESVDFFEANANENVDEEFEQILLDFDKKLRARGVRKSVNKANFDKYEEGLDKDFVQEVEKLFDM